MRNTRKNWASAIAVCLLILIPAVPALAGSSTSFTGTVTGGYAIETESGEYIDIGDTAKGLELADMPGVRVTVTGAIEEDEFGKVVVVTSYKVLDEVQPESVMEIPPEEESAPEGEEDYRGGE